MASQWVVVMTATTLEGRWRGECGEVREGKITLGCDFFGCNMMLSPGVWKGVREKLVKIVNRKKVGSRTLEAVAWYEGLS